MTSPSHGGQIVEEADATTTTDGGVGNIRHHLWCQLPVGQRAGASRALSDQVWHAFAEEVEEDATWHRTTTQLCAFWGQPN